MYMYITWACFRKAKKKKKRMFPVTCQKKNGSIGRDFFSFFLFDMFEGSLTM